MGDWGWQPNVFLNRNYQICAWAKLHINVSFIKELLALSVWSDKHVMKQSLNRQTYDETVIEQTDLFVTDIWLNRHWSDRFICYRHLMKRTLIRQWFMSQNMIRNHQVRLIKFSFFLSMSVLTNGSMFMIMCLIIVWSI